MTKSIDCRCGGRYMLYHRKRHLQTKKHKKHVAETPTKVEPKVETIKWTDEGWVINMSVQISKQS